MKRRVLERLNRPITKIKTQKTSHIPKRRLKKDPHKHFPIHQNQITPDQDLHQSSYYNKQDLDQDYLCPGCKEKVDIHNPETCIPECTHRFHEQCMKPWLQKHRTCPICRHQIKRYCLTSGKIVILSKKKNLEFQRVEEELWDEDFNSSSFQISSLDRGQGDSLDGGLDQQLDSEQESEQSESNQESVIVFSRGESMENSERNQEMPNSMELLEQLEYQLHKKRGKKSGRLRKMKELQAEQEDEELLQYLFEQDHKKAKSDKNAQR